MNKLKCTILKTIPNKMGDIRKILNYRDDDFVGFCEAYISEIKYKSIKGWKLHKNKVCNLIVVHGLVKFVAWDPNQPDKYETKLVGISESEPELFSRICIKENIWFAFQGLGEPVSRVLNISNINNEESISESLPLDYVNYSWSKF